MSFEDADDLAVFFDSGEFGETGSYRAGGTGDPVSITVILDKGTRRGAIADQEFVISGGSMLVRLSEVADPTDGDTIEVDSVTYTIQGEPELDITGKLWSIEARPS